MTWEEGLLLFIGLVVLSFIAGFIDVAHEEAQKQKEREERENGS